MLKSPVGQANIYRGYDTEKCVCDIFPITYSCLVFGFLLRVYVLILGYFRIIFGWLILILFLRFLEYVKWFQVWLICLPCNMEHTSILQGLPMLKGC